MTTILIILLIIILLGGGWGYRSGTVSMSNPLGIVLAVILILVLLSLIGGPRFGYW